MNDQKKIFVDGETVEFCLFVKNIAGISECNRDMDGFKPQCVIYLDAGHVVYARQGYGEVISMIDGCFHKPQKVKTVGLSGDISEQ